MLLNRDYGRSAIGAERPIPSDALCPAYRSTRLTDVYCLYCTTTDGRYDGSGTAVAPAAVAPSSLEELDEYDLTQELSFLFIKLYPMSEVQNEILL